MASKQIFVDLDLKGNKLNDAELALVGFQPVADAAALTTLASALTTASETRKIFVWKADSKTLHVWNGTSFDSPTSSIDGGLRLRGGVTVTSQITAADNVKKGDLWVFSNAGNWFNTVTGVAGAAPGFGTAYVVEPGDHVIFTGTPAGEFASDAELGVYANWTVIQNNVTAASDTVLGLVRTATQAQVNSGVSGAPLPAAVTPETLKATLQTAGNGVAANTGRKVVRLAIALVANTPVAVIHDFTTSGYITDKSQAQVTVIETATGEEIDLSVIKQANQITIETNKPVTVDVAISAL